ncbi:MAG: phage tail protein [Proteobacteria bacterium]|nr:MAG: phage tail protein [Pseudomonadota bacterium]
MPKIYELKEGDEIDLICFQHYGYSRGSVEEVLKANANKLKLFDDFGKVIELLSKETLILPDLPSPLTVQTSQRLFN